MRDVGFRGDFLWTLFYDFSFSKEDSGCLFVHKYGISTNTNIGSITFDMKKSAIKLTLEEGYLDVIYKK